MPFGPDAVGINGTSVRPNIQILFDKIDAALLDPVYVQNKNVATPADKANGGMIFKFEFEGFLNDVEKTTLANDWQMAGWDSAVVENKLQSPSELSKVAKWTFVLTKNPTTPP